MIWQILFILFSLLIQAFKHLFTPVPWSKDCVKVALETRLTLQTIFNNPFYDNKDIKTCPSENHREDLCTVSSCFWCNIRVPSMTGAVDSAAPREQPTTQNQCSCRFKQKKLDGWLRGNGEGCEIKKNKNKQKTAEQIQKWQREEEEHWELEEGKKRMGTESAWG